MKLDFIGITIQAMSPRLDTLSWEQVQEWAAAGVEDWARWTESEVNEFNAKRIAEHEKGHKYLLMRIEASDQAFRSELYNGGWQLVSTSAVTGRGLLTTWKSPLFAPGEAGLVTTECFDHILSALQALREAALTHSPSISFRDIGAGETAKGEE